VGEAVQRPRLVSVLMPFLNVAPYLADAIESVRAQTYPHWELLLVDDGSTDGSGEIARRYAALDPRVRALEHPGRANLGASASRNLALRHATGAYVALLDGDDLWLPPKLEEQVALLEATPAADVLVGSTEYWYGWTGRPEDVRLDRVVRIGVPNGTLLRPPALLTGALDEALAVPCTCSLVARRDAVRRAGGFEESFRRVYTDQAFYAKLFVASAVLVSETCWDRYRLRADSSCGSARRTSEMAATRLRWLAWLREYLAVRGVRDAALHAALRRAAWRARYPRALRLLRRVRRTFRAAHP
jgi:glycosyltransferase involved in cell wall biosynthesis